MILVSGTVSPPTTQMSTASTSTAPGTVPTFNSSFSCTGNETSLSNCSLTSLGQCTSQTAVLLQCGGNYTLSFLDYFIYMFILYVHVLQQGFELKDTRKMLLLGSQSGAAYSRWHLACFTRGRFALCAHKNFQKTLVSIDLK